MKQNRAQHSFPYIAKLGIRVVNSFMKLYVSASSFNQTKAGKPKLNC